MSRPPKAIQNTTGHRTIGEKKQREAAEKAALTGISIRERDEVSNNKRAHKEFLRMNALLTKVNKNDAIIETIINRYCILLAECVNLEEKQEKLYATAEKLEAKLDKLKDEATYTETKEAAKAISSIYNTAINCDKQIQQKRRMLFDIEKENGFTIAASLRNIPKKVDDSNPVADALKDDETE